ncbi:MAG: hypothetical protein IJV97_04375 [Alphaproteobacteria bacterium]|nr:hypothetical protein [Alphaproteobacteria bacterium]
MKKIIMIILCLAMSVSAFAKKIEAPNGDVVRLHEFDARGYYWSDSQIASVTEFLKTTDAGLSTAELIYKLKLFIYSNGFEQSFRVMSKETGEKILITWQETYNCGKKYERTGITQ